MRETVKMEIQLQRVWGKAQESAFLTSSRRMRMLLVREPQTLRITALLLRLSKHSQTNVLSLEKVMVPSNPWN